MSKGSKDGGYGGGGGPEGQSKKMCQVFLRNLPLAMLEPVSGGWGGGVMFGSFGGHRRSPGQQAALAGVLVAVCVSYLIPHCLTVVNVATGL